MKFLATMCVLGATALGSMGMTAAAKCCARCPDCCKTCCTTKDCCTADKCCGKCPDCCGKDCCK